MRNEIDVLLHGVCIYIYIYIHIYTHARLTCKFLGIIL